MNKITVCRHTREDVAALVARALEFAFQVTVRNVSGYKDAWEVTFDPTDSLANAEEIAYVLQGGCAPQTL